MLNSKSSSTKIVCFFDLFNEHMIVKERNKKQNELIEKFEREIEK